jgi:RNA-binding protein
MTIAKTLSGFQKRYLRSLSHSLKPTVFVGQKGYSRALVDAMDAALDRHELVKVKFIEFKKKDQKRDLIDRIEKAAGCEMIGLIGHMATFYRRQPDPDKRHITLPTQAGR